VEHRHFTVEEANRLLPWVREVLQNLRALRRETQGLEREISALTQRLQTNGSRSLAEALGWRRRALASLHRRLAEGLSTLEGQGILLRDLDRGLVDFPALREGRRIYLCWQEGEPRVLYWHEVDAGFAGRQPLDEEVG